MNPEEMILEPIKQQLPWHNIFHVEHIRDGKVINEFDVHNDVNDVGANSILGVQFHADSQITAWYLGLIDNSGFTAVANSDTMASHSGWNENVSYSDSTRIAWSPGGASSRSITNGTAATFNINGTAVIKGIFVASVSTKSGTSGTQWSTALFASTVSVTNGDQLKVTYTLSC